MSWRKLVIDDAAVYADRFVWRDWMWCYSTHQEQSQVIERYEFCKRVGADSATGPVSKSGSELWLYLESAGRKWKCPVNGIDKDFSGSWLDHPRIYRNSRTGQTWWHSLVYVDQRSEIVEACRKYGIEVEFRPFFREGEKGNPYIWLYVSYTMPVKPAHVLEGVYRWRSADMGSDVWYYDFGKSRVVEERRFKPSDKCDAELERMAGILTYGVRSRGVGPDADALFDEIFSCMSPAARNRWCRKVLNGGGMIESGN